jgi:glucose-1-phosphate cytidylyltransferase
MKDLQLINTDIHDWRITFADTGVNSNIGRRLKAVEKYRAGEEVFLARHSDGLTDLQLPAQLAHYQREKRVAASSEAESQLAGIGDAQWVNSR